MSTTTVRDGAGVFDKERGSGRPVVCSHEWTLLDAELPGFLDAER
jgi:hypothetical protein